VNTPERDELRGSARHLDDPAPPEAIATDPVVLRVRDLTVELDVAGGPAPVVSGVSFDVAPGETVALVGESGCGKSMTMLSVMGLHPPVARITGGSIDLGGEDLLRVPESRHRQLRGAEIAMVYQDPMTSLNPLMRIGDQIAEVFTAHGRPRRAGLERAVEVLAQVGIPRPERAVRAYPHEFSGGMRQRVVIAMALALRPKVLIADEPTTALDVTIQQQIITLVARLQAETGMAVVWVTHDLGVVARIADRVLVMYAGHLVEQAPTGSLFRSPQHPYTAGLLASLPPRRGDDRGTLAQIPGAPPDPSRPPSGCPFHPRCPQAVDRCRAELPPLTVRGDDAAACFVPPTDWEDLRAS
jgi:oligopeptide/dipeptide ABC transporter ATP-binding protein